MAQQDPFHLEEEEELRFRLMQTYELGSTKCLRKVLEWVTPRWQNMTFEKYLKTLKGVTVEQFENAINEDQKRVLKSDPDGKEWDASLLNILILFGNDGLSMRLEYLITKVKEERNALDQGWFRLDDQEFDNRTKSLFNLLEDILRSAGECSCHISQTVVADSVQEIEDLVARSKRNPIDLKDFFEYKQQVLFQEQLNLVKTEGVSALRKRYEKFESLTPVSRLVEDSFTVDEIFTDMLLEQGTRRGKLVKCEDIFEDDSKITTYPIILMEGPAGVGKTTIVKRILDDWGSRRGYMRHLLSVDILLHVECRSQINSFKELIHSSMSELDDLTFVVLALRCLIIIDGLDELNENTAQLFNEILNLKKKHNFRLLITTRPEAVKNYYIESKSYQLTTKHIWLLGIAQEKINYFVKQYFEAINKKIASRQSISELLAYLKKTELRMSETWKLPYNLILVTILWALKPDVVNDITTTPELYWQVHLLCRSKLLDCLQFNAVPPPGLEARLDYFFYVLGQESLKALKNDEINLTRLSYQELEKTCHDLNIPAEEVISFFLKRVTIGTDTTYSFSHKGHQEFMGAYYIREQLIERGPNYDIVMTKKIVVDSFLQNDISKENCMKMTQLLENKLTMTDTEILQDIFEQLYGSYPDDLVKYQNLFIQLIGLFHVDSCIIKDNTKEAVINLLKEAGVKDKNSWLNLLKNVKCDPVIATYITQKSNVNLLENPTEITESNIALYASLLKSLKPPLEHSEKIGIKIFLKDYIPEFDDLADAVATLKLFVPRVGLDTDFQYPAIIAPSVEGVKKLFQCIRCRVVIYKGMWMAGFELPQVISKLCAAIPNIDSYIDLMSKIDSLKKKLGTITLCLSADFQGIERLSPPIRAMNMNVFLTDVTDDYVNRACEILHCITPLPEDNRSYLTYVGFPRASLSLRGIKTLVDRIGEQFLMPAPNLPKHLCPSDPDTRVG